MCADHLQHRSYNSSIVALAGLVLRPARSRPLSVCCGWDPRVRVLESAHCDTGSPTGSCTDHQASCWAASAEDSQELCITSDGCLNLPSLAGVYFLPVQGDGMA